MNVDVEVALPGVGGSDASDLINSLPVDFFAEDRSDRGWGIVIRTSRDLPSDVEQAVTDFLEPLEGIADNIRNRKGILRVGVFHRTVNCTVELRSTALLAAFGLALEISTYPASDSED